MLIEAPKFQGMAFSVYSTVYFCVIVLGVPYNLCAVVQQENQDDITAPASPINIDYRQNHRAILIYRSFPESSLGIQIAVN